jgi:hypothetical protein
MKTSNSDHDLLDSALAELVRSLADEEFLERKLAESWTPGPAGAFVVGPGLVAKSPLASRLTATFLLFDSADSPGFGLPYRADLVSFGGAGWQLESIESMCVSCFGTGVLEGESRLCDTCGAVGWGVREVLASTEAAEKGPLAAVKGAG